MTMGKQDKLAHVSFHVQLSCLLGSFLLIAAVRAAGLGCFWVQRVPSWRLMTQPSLFTSVTCVIAVPPWYAGIGEAVSQHRSSNHIES